MKQIKLQTQLLAIFFAFCLFSCGNKTASKTSDADSIKDTTNFVDANFVEIEQEKFDVIYENCIFVRNKSDYSERFLKEFLEGHREYCKENNRRIFFLNDTLKMTGSGEYDNMVDFFPEDLPLNKHIEFEKILNDTIYNLGLKRINISTYEYGFQISTKEEEAIFRKMGKVDVTPTFYLAASGSWEDEENEVFGFYTDYVDFVDNKEYYLEISIGNISDNDNEDEIKTTFFYQYKKDDEVINIASPILNQKK